MKKTMFYLFIGLIVAQSTAFAATGVECSRSKAKSTHRISVQRGDFLTVKAVQVGGTGYKWLSAESLDSDSQSAGQIGSGVSLSFAIPTDAVSKKTYTFTYRRPFEPANKAVAVCKVVVKVTP